MRQRHRTDEESDRFGFEETGSRLATYAGKLVPQSVVRRAVAVSVSTDRDRYSVGDSVEITVEFRNRAPVPVTVELPTRRVWTWTVDGLPAASDERTRPPGGSGTLAFRPRERRVFTRSWDGRFERTDDGAAGTTRWERAGTGDHEIAARIAVGGERLSDRTTVEFEP